MTVERGGVRNAGQDGFHVEAATSCSSSLPFRRLLSRPAWIPWRQNITAKLRQPNVWRATKTHESREICDDPAQTLPNLYRQSFRLACRFARNIWADTVLFFRSWRMNKRDVPADHWRPLNMQLTLAQTSDHFHTKFDVVRQQLFRRIPSCKEMMCWHLKQTAVRILNGIHFCNDGLNFQEIS
jgi:hypothetical protein